MKKRIREIRKEINKLQRKHDTLINEYKKILDQLGVMENNLAEKLEKLEAIETNETSIMLFEKKREHQKELKDTTTKTRDDFITTIHRVNAIERELKKTKKQAKELRKEEAWLEQLLAKETAKSIKEASVGPKGHRPAADTNLGLKTATEASVGPKGHRPAAGCIKAPKGSTAPSTASIRSHRLFAPTKPKKDAKSAPKGSVSSEVSCGL